MNEADEQRRAEECIRRRLPDGLRDPRVVSIESDAKWVPGRLRTMAKHEFAVLERKADIVVFFDEHRAVRGWRDNGRLGAARPGMIDREAFRDAVIRELDLPPQSTLGKLEPALLPPVGWTYEGVLFCRPDPKPSAIVRVWASPTTLNVIQCLYEHAERPE